MLLRCIAGQEIQQVVNEVHAVLTKARNSSAKKKKNGVLLGNNVCGLYKFHTNESSMLIARQIYRPDVETFTSNNILLTIRS